MYKLYVIPGSHACRAAILMLDHKRVPYKRVDVLTLTHPWQVKLRGFDAGGERREAGGQRPRPLAQGDKLGTVPALNADGRRVSTSRQIARFLDEEHPDPPLFPADPDRRRAVEEVESWANGELQMATRRIALARAVHAPAEAGRATGDGRMGHLLYKRSLTRRLLIPLIGRRVFAVDSSEPDLIADLPPLLDRVDAHIEDGLLNGTELNAADFMVASCLALVLYREDALPLFEGRPSLELVDRLLPEPA
jgi:glutathione S-transferase